METLNKGLAGSNEFGITLGSNSRKSLGEILPIFFDSKKKEIKYGAECIVNYKVDASVNTKDEKFNILDIEGHLIEELEIRMPSNINSVQFNRDTTKNDLGIIKVEYFDTSAIENGENMFAGCWNLEYVNFSSDTSKIKNMNGMFSLCTALDAIPENLDTSKCESMERMFEYCVKLEVIPDRFNTSSCITMESTFRGCRKLGDIPPTLDLSKVKTFKECFEYCSSLMSFPQLPLPAVENMKKMFYGCEQLTEIHDFSETPNLVTIDTMFKGCTSLVSVGYLDVSRVMYFNDVFNGCTYLSQPPKWNTASAVVMARMFKDCENLMELPEYDMTHVINVNEMFCNCPSIITQFTETFEIVKFEREPEIITKVEWIEVEEMQPKKDENGKDIIGPDGKPIYELVTVKKEQETSTVIWHEVFAKDEISVPNCIDRTKWWKWYVDIPKFTIKDGVVVNSGEKLTVGKFTENKDCFKGCSFYNQKGILSEWYKDYSGEETDLIYIYKVNYRTTSTAVYNTVVHSYKKVESIDDIKQMERQMVKLLDQIEVNIVSLELFESYVLPKKKPE